MSFGPGSVGYKVPMWETPYYRLPFHGKKILVDVTLAAPRQPEPVSVLPDVLAYLKKEQISSILDFGAGKLRNTLYLLKRGFQVYAVEYEAQFTQYELSKTRLAQARRYPNFRQLIFPHEFFECERRFDLAILVNVVNYIPVKRHRSLVIKYCAQKLRDRGWLLWVSQYGDTHYRDRLTEELKDGFLLHSDRERSTFYREFTVEEVDRMISAQGLKLVRRFPFWKNQARLFQLSH